VAVLIYIAKEKEKIHFQDYLDILCNPVEVVNYFTVFRALPGPARHTWVLSFTVDLWIPSRYEGLHAGTVGKTYL
jgi:hypothetical protein